MRFTTLHSLFSFTLYAVLTTSVVVAIPIKGQGHGADVAPAAKRSLAPASLYRRNGEIPGHVRSRSIVDNTRLRELIGDTPRYRRDGTSVSSEKDTTTLAQFDGDHKYRLAKSPDIELKDMIGEGTFGKVYPDPHDTQHQVIKHMVSDLSAGSMMVITPGALKKELKYLQLAGQFVKLGYTVTSTPSGEAIKEAWFWMKKVNGVPFKSLGFKQNANSQETSKVPKAFPRHSQHRKTFLDTVVDMCVAKEMEYEKDKKVKQMDFNLGNIMIKFKAGSSTYEIESVDFVDWARGRSVTPEFPAGTKEAIKAVIMERLVNFYDKK